ncbi:MAG TPA: CmcI family methyltransferase [Polyangia bacterium]
MKLTIDTDKQVVAVTEADGRQVEQPLYSNESFALLSGVWSKLAWNQKYTYGFSWMGRPIIQLPEDMVRIQETIYRTKPDVVIETGVAHGGSLVFYASVLRAMGKGRVVGIDIEIRPHNRRTIEAHEMSSLITLVEGSSTAPEIIKQVKDLVKPGERVMVILDSNHTKAHVAKELELYAPMVTEGCYLVATDGMMELLHDVPRGQADWSWDNPSAAAREFAQANSQFVLETTPFVFDETLSKHQITHWPDAYLRRR